MITNIQQKFSKNFPMLMYINLEKEDVLKEEHLKYMVMDKIKDM